jgi:hypothetical protein
MTGPFVEDMAFTAPWVVVEDPVDVAFRAAAGFASSPALLVEVEEVGVVTGLAVVAVLVADRATARRRLTTSAAPPATTGRFAVP